METEEERIIRRRKRLEEMKRQKKRAQLINRLFPAAVVLVLAAGAAGIGISAGKSAGVHAEKENAGEALPEATVSAPSDTQEEKGKKERIEREAAPEEVLPGQTTGEQGVFSPVSTMATMEFSEDIVSQYGVFIDVEAENILAQREAYTRMNPASMTKILTLLVAAERIEEEQFTDSVPITIDITDYCYVNDCSVVGFSLNEDVEIRDLFYGTILPSGADAAVALAKYVAGSQEAFVKLMNDKLEELGLSETTHFTNCVGLYDEDHYSTAYDMAMILKAAADNEFCREVLSAHTYRTGQTTEHPKGIVLSNWFLRRIEDRDTHGLVLCGKTGYVEKSGNCAASLGVDENGREYICVTAGSKGNQRCIEDQAVLYRLFLPEPEE